MQFIAVVETGIRHHREPAARVRERLGLQPLSRGGSMAGKTEAAVRLREEGTPLRRSMRDTVQQSLSQILGGKGIVPVDDCCYSRHKELIAFVAA
jgi:hypothetical protein